MDKVYIIHGWRGSPREPMHLWMKNKLEKRNFSVVAPRMPHPENPKIESWVNKLFEIVDLNDDVYLIGHSIGCQAVLRYIERINNKVNCVVLIAPWMHLNEETIEKEGGEAKEMARPWIETPIDFKKIKSHVKNQIVCLFSDNDKYVPLSNAEIFKEKLNAKIIIEKNKGHFDKENHITENKTAVNEILKIKEKN